LIPLGGEMIKAVSPFKDSTAAGRLLSKRGHGGYMTCCGKRSRCISMENCAKLLAS
ncbi:uncharacterized protein M421DRAFT_77664, partial [Didymella exigua CBS 183.55]